MEVKVTQDYAALKRDLLRTKILNSRKSIEDEKKILVAEKKIESKELDEKCNMARMQEDDEKRQRANNEKKRWTIQVNKLKMSPKLMTFSLILIMISLRYYF